MYILRAKYFVSLLFLAYSLPVLSGGYGIYDARAMSMGGTGVALGTTDNGFFYNPSLIAFHYEREDRSKDGRIYFPMIAGQGTESSADAFDLVNDDLDYELGQALDRYNADPTIANAQSAFNIVRQLESAVDGIIDQDIIADAYGGFAISEPGQLNGGAFFVGMRAVGGGVADVSDQDRQLFRDYMDALEFIATGGTSGSPNLQLLDANGAFIDPYETIDATVAARGALILETGLAVAKLIEWKGYKFTLGITPKLMRLNTYDETRAVNSAEVNFSSNAESHLAINADIGASMQIGEHFRVALASKDIIERDYETELNNTISLVPRSRLGMAYIHDRFSIGLDYDLEKSTPFVNEAVRQDVSFGAEVAIKNFLKLRVGYRSDLEDNYEPVTSYGIGLDIKHWLIDIAMINAEGEIGGAFQLGWGF